MIIEYGMYFALGFLAAALIAIAIGPAFWRRAVRLTKRRIEAATPVTLSEFRADKDKLRAEFAIALRKRDMHIDMLRDKFTAKIVELDAARIELAALKSERDEQFAAIEANRLREDELATRIRDLERDGAALAARVRRADDDFADIAPDLMPEQSETISAEQLSGDYRSDVEDLLTALSIERQRNSYLEEQARMLLARLEKKRKSGLKDEAIAMLRDTLAAQSDPQSEARVDLRKAEARISGAETRLNALLAETETSSENDSGLNGQASPARLLAEDFSASEQEGRIRETVEGLEDRVMADWETERFDADRLRGELKAIAGDVSRLVYAEDAEDAKGLTESLFDRVSKFAGDGLDVEHLARSEGAVAEGGPISDRMTALGDKYATQS